MPAWMDLWPVPFDGGGNLVFPSIECINNYGKTVDLNASMAIALPFIFQEQY
jgi:hypothetical protein